MEAKCNVLLPGASGPRPAMHLENQDCIVVGAGPAGLALTRSLLLRGLSVALVDAGGRNAARHPLCQGLDDFFRASTCRELTMVEASEAQQHLLGRVAPMWRGRGFGGGGLINGGLWCRGRREDYAVWPWDAQTIESAFKAVEDVIKPEHVACAGNGRLMLDVFAEAGIKQLSGAGFVEDGVKDGFLSGRDGRRTFPAAAFLDTLAPEQFSRLSICENTTTRRVLVKDGRAHGIEVVHGGNITQMLLSKKGSEVVLCAGTIGTPKILMLSGIGPKAHLQAMGIDVVSEIPAVGQNLQDHLMLPVMFKSNRKIVQADGNGTCVYGFVHTKIPDPDAKDGGGGSRGCDIMVTNSNVVASILPIVIPMAIPGISWLARGARVLMRTLLWGLFKLPFFANVFIQTCGLHVTIMQPFSKGSVMLRSSNPRDEPRVNVNYLSDPRDVRMVHDGLAKIREMLAASPTSKEIFGPAMRPNINEMLTSPDADRLVEDWARQSASPYFHFIGTCRMKSAVGGDCVVDERLSVAGVQGLRVADASVAPCPPCAPTQAMAYMVGHVASSFVCA